MVFNSNKYIPLTDSTNTVTNSKNELSDEKIKRMKLTDELRVESGNYEKEVGNQINSCEIGEMKDNPYFTVEIVNFPPKSVLSKNQKINNIVSKEKLKNAIHVQQKVTKSLNTEESSTPHSLLDSQEKSKKFFNFLSKNKKEKSTKNSFYEKTIKQLGPFKEVKIYSKTPLSFNNHKSEYINVNLKQYFKFPHKSIPYENSKLFSSIHKQFGLSLDSVFSNFIEFNNQFYVLLGKEVILFSNKKAYVPNTLKMELINNEIEFSEAQKENLISIKGDSCFDQLLRNQELITNSPTYLILDDINMELLVDHLLNSNTLPYLPFIFSTYKFDNSIIYTPNVRALGVIKDNSGINYGYKLSGYGLIEDIINELTSRCLDNCEKKTNDGKICDFCYDLNSEIQFIFQ